MEFWVSILLQIRFFRLEDISVLALVILAGNAVAGDYSEYTTEELANMRGTMQDVSAEERDAFRAFCAAVERS